LECGLAVVGPTVDGSLHIMRIMPGSGSIRMPKDLQVLLIIVLGYVAAPMRDVPLLGLSLSAPVFFVLVLRMAKLGYLRPVFRQRYWFLPVFLFCLGLAASTFANSIFGSANEVSIPTMLHLIAAFAYWGLMFLVVAFLVGYFRYWGPALRVVGLGVIVLAAAVIAEYALGREGVSGHARGVLTLLTQNDIGIQFSAFGLAPLGMALRGRGIRRMGWIIGAAVVVVAAVVNASRSSWIALSIGMVVIVVLSKSGRVRKQALLAGILGAVLVVVALVNAPPQFTEKFYRRSATLENLNRDKSFQTRLALVQKAWKLFVKYPLIGVGPGMFRYRYIDIDLPSVLGDRYREINRKSAHNAYMLMLAEGGLIVILPLIWLLFRLGSQGLRAARRIGARYPEMVLFTGMFVSLSIHLWTLAGLGSSDAWVVYGLVASTSWAFQRVQGDSGRKTAPLQYHGSHRGSNRVFIRQGYR